MPHTVESFGPELDGGSGGVSIDAAGNVYVADFGAILSDHATMGRKIFRITPQGEASVFATGFEGASGNEFDSSGYLYQSNIRGNFIARISPDGTWTEFARDGIESPVGIAIDDDDTLYVANCGANTLQRVTADGESTLFASDPLLQGPNGMTLDEDRNVYVANFENGDVLKVNPAGAVSRLATVPGSNNGHLQYHDGNLYVVARGAHRIFRVTLDGEVQPFAGTGQRGRRDGPALEATLSYPNDLKIAPDGTFYLNELVSTTGPETELSPMGVRRIHVEP